MFCDQKRRFPKFPLFCVLEDTRHARLMGAKGESTLFHLEKEHALGTNIKEGLLSSDLARSVFSI